MLRILVVLPLYGGSLPIGRYCAATLTAMGHSTRVFDAPQLFPAWQGLRKLDISPGALPTLENTFLRLVSQALWLQAQEQRPQLVLALAQAPVDRHVLQRMRQAGMRTVMWFVEDFRLFSYWQIIAPFYDAFAVIQKEPFLSELAAIGQKRAFYLPLAALPNFHKQQELSQDAIATFGSDISFLGAGYPNRRKAFIPFADKNFKIWGSDWEGADQLIDNIQLAGKRISEEDAVKIYNAAKINLNLHSSIKPEPIVTQGDFVNPRTFELASIGAFQLTDNRSLLGELFNSAEIATFATPEELYAKTEYFLKHPEERKKYATAARERVLREHTYEKRMQTLIDYMEANFGPWPDNEREEAKIAPDLANKLKNLAPGLGLKPDAATEDIIAALRRKREPLSPEETALLLAVASSGQFAK